MKNSSKWGNIFSISGKTYKCPYCNSIVAPSYGYFNTERNVENRLRRDYIFICPNCNQPTYLDTSYNQYPGPKFGNDISNLPDSVLSIYDQARNCMSVNAFTASVMLCRKIIMNASVNHGAKEGESFAFYIDYLFDNHYIPINSKKWVDNIRSKGNVANHKIEDIKREEAEDILKFTEVLLRNLYEFQSPTTKD